MALVLIVDDDSAMRDALAEAVRDLGFDPLPAASGHDALLALDQGPADGVLLDLRMPGMDGLEVLRRIRAGPQAPPVTILTAHATATNTIEAMRLGAFDHLTKPIGRADLALVLSHMMASRTERHATRSVATEDELIGSSEAIRIVQKQIGMLADSDASVLITGETGTGKELVARAIHDHGYRGRNPFIAVNCAAIPAELLESELFGHTRGAFTGALADHAGAFRQAEGGTLFLDEIGDMTLAMQAKILRALQERVVTPVGGKALRVDVRVIAATHRDLVEHIRNGAFREDLFYRLNVVPIHLPALRERIADVLPLAEHFLARAGSKKQIAPAAAARLVQYSWPGNVRELKNAMERVTVFGRSEMIEIGDIAFLEAAQAGSAEPTEPTSWPDEDLPTALMRLEEMLIRRALQRTAGNRAEAARMLNIHRQLLYTKIRRYGLDLSEDRTNGVGSPDAERH
jgi:two-component system NtrC family response regulator